VSLNGSGSPNPQTFSVTSSNPDVKASVATGEFWTINVTHTAASGHPGDVSFSGPITYQLFSDLTPKTYNLWTTFTTDGYFVGKDITRIVKNFSGGTAGDFVIQGGAPNPDGSGNSGQPGTPYGLELSQQLAFTGPGTLAVANTGQPNSNDTQFFFTTGPETELAYGYTIFGQVVAGQNIINDLKNVAVTTSSSGENSFPVSPVTITSSTLTPGNPNGVIHIDTTGAVPNESSKVTVTATDPTTHTTATQSFQVSVGPNVMNSGTHSSNITFSPLGFPVSQQVASGTASSIQLLGSNQNPNASAVKIGYSLASQPAHGTITGFNPTTGVLTYTSNAGYTGPDSFTYTVTNTGGTPSSITGNTATVSLMVTPPAATPVNTGAVRQIGTFLVVTPLPRTDKGTNTIDITETDNPSSPANNLLVVSVNGQIDALQPMASSITGIVVYGAKASDKVTINPAVDPTISVTLDGGHGGKNVLQAGAGSTREHGWFGFNTLIGGTGPNQLVGRAGHVAFKPTDTTNEIFAGVPNPGYRVHRHFLHNNYHLNAPGGTFFKSVNGKAVPIPTPGLGSKGKSTIVKPTIV
jgi:cyclophilin family peptidyl-prolyl cis-trans isomerase